MTTAWHSDEPFEFRREYIDELAALRIEKITRPERYFLIAATGDEVLDYRDMVAHYAGAKRLGHGKGYVYSHDAEHGVAEQQYLPDALEGTEYYTPTANGYEREVGPRLERLRKITRGH